MTSSNVRIYRTVPTQDEILVPETLLKKRKGQEAKSQEEAAKREEKREVCLQFTSYSPE